MLAAEGPDSKCFDTCLQSNRARVRDRTTGPEDLGPPQGSLGNPRKPRNFGYFPRFFGYFRDFWSNIRVFGQNKVGIV